MMTMISKKKKKMMMMMMMVLTMVMVKVVMMNIAEMTTSSGDVMRSFNRNIHGDED